jgi:radical SAM protein with 4Fe4S-binding SPASM domain
MPSVDDVIAAFESARPFVESHGVHFFATMPLPRCVFPRERFPFVAMNDCPIGTERQEFAIGPRGEIRHCALHIDPIARDVMDGEVDLEKVFASGDPHAYRTALPEPCRACEHRAQCAGGCGAAAFWVHGARTEVDPFVKSRVRLPIL